MEMTEKTKMISSGEWKWTLRKNGNGKGMARQSGNSTALTAKSTLQAVFRRAAPESASGAQRHTRR